MRRELAKDPKLATESWDRFLPQFRRKHLSTSQKTAKKHDRIAQKHAAHADASGTGAAPAPAATKEQPKKKIYTPFPPPQLPRKVSTSRIRRRLRLMDTFEDRSPAGIWRIFPQFAAKGRSGGSQAEAEGAWFPAHVLGLAADLTLQQAEAASKRQGERAEAFVAPAEAAEPTVEEKRKRKKREGDGDGETRKRKKKKSSDTVVSA